MNINNYQMKIVRISKIILILILLNSWKAVEIAKDQDTNTNREKPYKPFQTLESLALAGGLSYYLLSDKSDEVNNLSKKLDKKKTELFMIQEKSRASEDSIRNSLRSLRNKISEMDFTIKEKMIRLNEDTYRAVGYLSL